MNQRGTLTLPKEVRKRLGLERGGVVMAEESDEPVLKPAVAFPIETYSDERITEFEKEEKKLALRLKKRNSK